MKDNKIFNPPQIAKMLGVTPAWVCRLCTQEKLKGTKLGKYWAIHGKDLQVYLRRHKLKRIISNNDK